MMESILMATDIAVVKGAEAAAQTAISDAAIVDLQGFDSVLLIAVVGSAAANAVTTLKAYCGDNSALSDGAYKDTNAAHKASSTTSDANKALVLDLVRPGCRYVRADVTRSGADVALSGIVAIRYNAKSRPHEHGDTVLDGKLSVN